MIVNYGVRNIKRKIYDIGVIKALGAKNKSLYNVFLIQVVHLLSYVSIISITTLIFLDDYVNL